jgi:hypothetical protein
VYDDTEFRNLKKTKPQKVSSTVVDIRVGRETIAIAANDNPAKKGDMRNEDVVAEHRKKMMRCLKVRERSCTLLQPSSFLHDAMLLTQSQFKTKRELERLHKEAEDARILSAAAVASLQD